MTKKAKDDFVFEDELNKLENIVKSLENGKISLEESIRLYEEGIKISVRCSKVLEEAKQKIEIIKSENFEETNIQADKILEI